MKPGSPRGWLPHRPSTPAEALTWDATRYLLDDLDPTEVAAFERRLGRDQAVREALALAVELAGAIVLAAPACQPAALPPALPVMTLAPRPSRRTAVGFVRRGLMASAAAALLVAGVWGLVAAGRLGPGRGDAWRIAATWVDLHQGEAAGTQDPDSGALADGAVDSETEVVAVPAERPVPSWMVAAVAVVAPDPTEMRDRSDMGDMDETGSLMDEGD